MYTILMHFRTKGDVPSARPPVIKPTESHSRLFIGLGSSPLKVLAAMQIGYCPSDCLTILRIFSLARYATLLPSLMPVQDWEETALMEFLLTSPSLMLADCAPMGPLESAEISLSKIPFSWLQGTRDLQHIRKFWQRMNTPADTGRGIV